MPQNLIVFIKNPVLGTVKTRLAKTEGDKVALKVYKDLMEKCRQETEQVAAERFLFYSEEIKDDNWSTTFFQKHLQAEGDLGAKIEAAFEVVFEQSPSKTLIIGSDCYDLSAEIIEKAFKKLESFDVVIGPANDGGYYLLGINEAHPELFEKINWSTEQVLEQTVVQAKQKGLSVELLEVLIDIDNIEDLKASGYKNVEC